MANLHGIYLRTGCFCNPGACQKFLNLSPQEVRKHFEAGHVCGDEHDLVDGYPTGSIRISFGYMSTYEDADKFLSMIKSCFIEEKRSISMCKTNGYIFEGILSPSGINIGNARTNGYIPAPNKMETTGKLEKIFLYPVKSCAAFEVRGPWKLTSIGLEYDRRWMIVNGSGSCVSQKQIKNLCTLKPDLDFSTNSLKLRINDSEMSVPLKQPTETYTNAYFCDSKVCGDKVQGYDCGDKVAEWLSDNLESPGLRLLRQCDFTEDISGRSSKEGQQTLLSLANKAEYLLVNVASARWLRERIPQEDVLCHSLESILLRFRANFVVDFTKPFVENELDVLLFDDVCFKLSGYCTRCQTICIDQKTGEISKEPLQTLSKELKGKIQFGVYLSRQSNRTVDTDVIIKTGCSVTAQFKTDT